MRYLIFLLAFAVGIFFVTFNTHDFYTESEIKVVGTVSPQELKNFDTIFWNRAEKVHEEFPDGIPHFVTDARIYEIKWCQTPQPPKIVENTYRTELWVCTEQELSNLLELAFLSIGNTTEMGRTAELIYHKNKNYQDFNHPLY